MIHHSRMVVFNLLFNLCTPFSALSVCPYPTPQAGILQFATRLTSECEANLTSVERLTHYAGDAVPHEQETVILSPHHLEKGGSAIFAASKAPDEDMAAVAEFDAAVATIELDAAAAPIKVSVMSTLVVAPQSACCTRKGIRLPQYAFPGWYSSSWNRSLVAADWPRHGAIEFDRVFMRYRADLPPVLSDLSFAAQAGQTVVVVGRTGGIRVMFAYLPMLMHLLLVCLFCC